MTKPEDSREGCKISSNVSLDEVGLNLAQARGKNSTDNKQEVEGIFFSSRKIKGHWVFFVFSIEKPGEGGEEKKRQSTRRA